MKVATITAGRSGFSQLKDRLRLFESSLDSASRQECSFIVFPGGFFRVTPSNCDQLENQLKAVVKAAGVPCAVGIDPPKDLKAVKTRAKSSLGYKTHKSMSFSDGRISCPEVWLVSNTVSRFREAWNKGGRNDPLIKEDRCTDMGALSVLPLCCGDAFIADLTSPRERVDLVAVTVHWSMWPVEWMRSLRAIALRNQAPVVVAQHLVVLPGRNYVYDENGNTCQPVSEEWISAGSVRACIRFFLVGRATPPGA